MLQSEVMKYALLSFVLALSIGLGAWSQVDPNIEWKLIQLPHFDLIFDAKHQELATEYASHLEEIVSTLGHVFSQIPEKTLIVLNDRTDLTNGYATPLPTSTIMVFPVLPGPLESIYEHGDWPRELVMHEYTHILSFEPRRGVVRVLHNMFGTIMTPNILLPRWWLEGIAVEMETRQSSFGRLRSLSQEAALRSYAVVDGGLEKIDLAQINEVTIPTWPGGSRPYLFGSLMWSYMLEKNNLQLVDALHQRHGGRIPFFIDTPVVDKTGKDYEFIFEEMKQDLKARLQLQLSELKKISPHESTGFMSKASETFSPVISPDGLKMLYLVKDETTKRSIRILQRPTKDIRFSEDQEHGKITQRLIEQSDGMKPIPGRLQEEPDGPPAGTISRMSWFPDSKKFLFDKVGDFNRFHETSDLWLYDLDSQKAEALSSGLRVREPSVSPNGEDAALVKLGPGTTQIVKFHLADKKEELLYSPELLATVSFPTYLNDSEIVFTERSRRGHEKMLKLSLKDKTVSEVLSKYDQPRLSTISKQGLLFVSSQNRVPNLYLANSDLKTAHALTHSLTGISASTLDPENQDLYVTELSAKGNQIRILTGKETARFSKSQLPSPKPLFADRYDRTLAAVEDISPPSIPPIFQTEDYSPYSHLWPHYWLPGLYIGNYGALISASTGGSDPVGLHTYSLALGYDTDSKDLGYMLLYQNQVFTPLIAVSAMDNKTSIPLTGIELRKKWQILEGQWQLSKVSTYLDIVAGWAWRSSEFTNSSKLFSTGPSFGFQYSDYTQAGAQISPESGQGIRLVDTSFVKDDSKEGFNELRLSAVKFFSKWLPSRHAIMFKAQGRLIEDNVSPANYESSSSYATYNSTLFPQYLMRGYRMGQFLAKSYMNYTAEYRMPLMKVYHGSGTTPIYVKQIHGAVIAEGLQLDGYAYKDELNGLSGFPFEVVPKWKIFGDAGLEIKMDVTLGYHFPVTLFAGVYSPFESPYRTDPLQYGMGFLF